MSHMTRPAARMLSDEQILLSGARRSPFVHRCEAQNFLLYDAADRMQAALGPLGFRLRPLARAFCHGAIWRVRMVWRRHSDRQAAVLYLRIPVDPAR